VTLIISSEGVNYQTLFFRLLHKTLLLRHRPAIHSRLPLHVRMPRFKVPRDGNALEKLLPHLLLFYISLTFIFNQSLVHTIHLNFRNIYYFLLGHRRERYDADSLSSFGLQEIRYYFSSVTSAVDTDTSFNFAVKTGTERLDRCASARSVALRWRYLIALQVGIRARDFYAVNEMLVCMFFMTNDVRFGSGTAVLKRRHSSYSGICHPPIFMLLGAFGICISLRPSKD